METRNVTGAQGVILRGYGELEIVQDPGAAGRETVVVEADENLLPRIRTEVRDGRLVIGFTIAWHEWLTFWWSWLSLETRRVRFRLTAAAVRSVSLTGAGKVRGERLEGDRLEVTISGAGKLEMGGLALRELSSRLSGAGDVEVAGSADSHEAHLSGAGSIRAARLATKRTKVAISGSGSMSASVAEELDARISGAGSITYEGSPKTVSQRVTGAGRVRKAG
jgi:hypothetical protein